MSLILNDGRYDQCGRISGLPASTDIDIEITLSTNGANFYDVISRSFIVDIRNQAVNSGARSYRNGAVVFIFESIKLQIDSGTVYDSITQPTYATIAPLLVSGAVVKFQDVPVTTTDVNIFGTDDGTDYGSYWDVSQVVIKRSSDDVVLATLDTSTPAASYTDSGITMTIVNYQTVDTDPPDFTSGPSAGSATGTGHTITATLDENGTIYAVRLADAAGALTSAQVKAGTDPSILESKSVSATIATQASVTFTTASASTPYDYYVVAEDESGNLQLSPTLIDATTTAGSFTIDGGVLTLGAGFNFTYTGMSGVDTPITVGPDSQGNSITVAVTDNADGTGFGTMPALPSSGTSSLLLLENNLTVTATEP